DPALHTREAFVATAVQAMAALEQTDATLATGSPLLGVAEPAFLLEPFALLALGGAIGDGEPLDSPSAGSVLVALREEGRVGGDQIGLAAQEFLMDSDRWQEQITVARALGVDLEVRDDLRFGLLDLDHLAELGGFGGFALADNFRVRLEEAHDLAGNMGVALEDALTRLMHELAHPGKHPLEVGALRIQGDRLEKAAGTLAAAGDFLGEALGLAEHPSAVVEELAVVALEASLALRDATAAGLGDPPHVIADGPGAIAQPRARTAGHLADALH